MGLVRPAYSLEQSTACDHSVASRMQRRRGVTADEGRGRRNHIDKEGPPMKAAKRVVAITVSVVALAFSSSYGIAQQVTGDVGFAHRHHHHQRETAAAARSEVRRGDQGKGLGVESLVAATRRAAQGRAQHLAHHDRRLPASARPAPSVASFRHRHWIASPRAGCVTRISSPRRSARPRAPP